jgi:hypothetical protein
MIWVILVAIVIGVLAMRLLQKQGQLGMFVVGHNAYWEPDFLTSPDGINWTERSAGVAPIGAGSEIWEVCWSPDLQLLVAVRRGGGTEIHSVARSTDGVNWDTDTMPVNYLRSIVWSPDLQLFCAVGADGDSEAYVYTSPDGINWTSRTPIATHNNWYDICWSPELTLFVAVGYDSNAVMTSPDGINWTERTGATGECSGVCWSPELSLFVAVGYDTPTFTSYVMTSPDGINWTSRTPPSSPTQSTWKKVAWSPELGLFAACASTGDYRIMTSPDGETWTERSVSDTSSMVDICWSPELSLFVSCGVLGNYRIKYSSDGINWTSVANTYANYSINWAA